MLGLDFKAVSAVFRKDMRTYLGNPTGWVFVTLFILASGAFTVLRPAFFARNLADLATLNEFMPFLLVLFIPAITMNAWADERRNGTDELLLTLPVRDVEVVLGKYLGVLGMFTLALLFTAAAQLSVLASLGDPDSGLMFSTVAGYWLMGALFIGVSLVGSILTDNTTVAFVFGVLGCMLLVWAGAVPWASGLVGAVLLGLLGAFVFFAVRGQSSFAGLVGLATFVLGLVMWQSRNFGDEEPSSGAEAAVEGATEAVADLSTRFEQVFSTLSIRDHFESFGEGVIRMGDLAYFVGGVVVLLYLCSFLLGRRHW